jgi:CRISPR/Cas system-associated endonuclease Cas1
VVLAMGIFQYCFSVSASVKYNTLPSFCITRHLLSPQSEYRPTEYVQGWMAFWFEENKRLKVAKQFQQQRIEYMQKV